ncbi:MAG: PDDEXK nuclease domain-containing protein [Endomicrobium sp.]|jgi:predicted nuclease of restriction endonuclease-like (RecB) superfamily|nr:PDDEXK nuclease domain-containing protein [Endomicrobium sp.]
MKKSISAKKNYIIEIKQILADARNKAYSTVNSAMVEAYWLTGKRIVEEEQKGQKRAEYGEKILQTLSVALTKEFGTGFSEQNIRNFRQFYLTFSEFTQFATHCVANLSWSHLRLIMRVSNPDARNYYMKEASEQHWSVRTLDRNISTLYYNRLLSSQKKEPVIKEMKNKTKGLQDDKLDFIKNPSTLEFLGLPSNSGYTEAQLEQAIIDNLQKFLLELGKGFAFIARQQHIKTEHSDFYIDLVFYNYILKCFVIIELKTGKITHQDIGQLDMYVRMYDDLYRRRGDGSTIGLLLCSETDKIIARYSVLNKNKQLFTSKYMTYLPTEKELVEEIERQKRIFRLQFEK